MLTIILFLALIALPLAVAKLRSHFIRARIEQGQRVRCVLADDVDRWTQERDQ